MKKLRGKAMQKLEFREAVKMLDAGFYLMHISWLRQTPRHEIARVNTEMHAFPRAERH